MEQDHYPLGRAGTPEINSRKGLALTATKTGDRGYTGYGVRIGEYMQISAVLHPLTGPTTDTLARFTYFEL
jgi:hypothetical protein